MLLIINKPIPNFSPLAVICRHNPWPYTQSHTLTLVQWGGGGEGVLGLLDPPLFRFCLQWKAFDLLYKMKYILCVVALLDVCNVTKHGRHLNNFLRLSKINNYFASFYPEVFLLFLKEVEKHAFSFTNGLTAC